MHAGMANEVLQDGGNHLLSLISMDLRGVHVRLWPPSLPSPPDSQTSRFGPSPCLLRSVHWCTRGKLCLCPSLLSIPAAAHTLWASCSETCSKPRTARSPEHRSSL